MTMEDSERNGKYEELRLLYSVSVSDIAGFKQQQWHVTNYGLLLYAAIVSIPKIVDNLLLNEFGVLYVASFGVMVAGWYLVGLLHKSIQERRARLVECRKLFTKEFMIAWRGGKSEEEAPDLPDRPEEKTSLLWLFRVIFGIGFLVDSWILYRLACAT